MSEKMTKAEAAAFVVRTHEAIDARIVKLTEMLVSGNVGGYVLENRCAKLYHLEGSRTTVHLHEATIYPSLTRIPQRKPRDYNGNVYVVTQITPKLLENIIRGQYAAKDYFTQVMKEHYSD